MKPLFIKKNGTVSKISGIVMNLIPSYTLAEYNALTHKPLFWVRTDEEYAQISSENVSYGNSTVKEELDEINADIFKRPIGYDFDNRVGLTNGVEYTAPSDGLIRVSCGRTNGNYTKLFIGSSAMVVMSYANGMNANNSLCEIIPAYKGWKYTLDVSNTTDGSSAVFFPYIYS